jgi:glycine betaine/proline transport system permease protein
MLGSHSLSDPRLARRRLWPYALTVMVAVGIVAVALLQPAATEPFPAAWNLGLRRPIDQFQAWVIGHRNDHPAFHYFFEPLSDLIDFGLRRVEALLLALPWTVVVGGFGLLGYWLGGRRMAGWAVTGLLFVGLVGLWPEGMQTLALMAVAVFISLLIGIPLGIWCARSRTLDTVLRPVLDGMQTMPAFVYLIPVLLFFGVARVPSVVATVIYALPPAIRLTSLGLRQVSPQAIEAARAFGSTPRQMLFKVQLPLALPSIMTGVNQTIMMALGIVVIAALIGAGGLGNVVMRALQRLQVGRAVEAGQSIVFLAIVLDRLSEGFSRLDLTQSRPVRRPAGALQRAWAWPARTLGALAGRLSRSPETAQTAVSRHGFLVNSLLILAFLWLAGALAGAAAGFPAGWRLPIAGPIDALVAWMRDNLYQIGGLPIGTGPLSDFITLQILNPLRLLFVDWLPWVVVVLGAGLLGWAAGGWQLALVAGAGLFSVGLLGMWAESMDTLSQVLTAVSFTAALALPLGILSARYDRFQAVLRPLLDTLQTIPSFVFLVPVIMLFNVGRVPGLIAAVLYALPPGIKLIDLGLRQVEPAAVEAARAFGSTYRQTLTKVLLPLAMPSIMLGINQIIMMVLAMVVISGLVGGAGLGLEAVTGLARNETGRGIEAGLAIVLMAIVLDRITQAWAAKRQT